MTKYYGKYRGKVAANEDPMRMGRLMVSAPDVSVAYVSTWALPAVPFAGPGTGFVALPPLGANVWLEFEQGNIDFPVWSGCFWGSAAEVPAAALSQTAFPQSIVLETAGGNVLTLSDLPGAAGGILLKSNSGATIAISDMGITISNGQGASITLTGPGVDINQGSLTIP